MPSSDKDIHSEIALLNALQKVAIASNEAETKNEAVKIGIEEVCNYTGWSIGHCYCFVEH